jgi:hypothetical protein
VGFIVVIFDSTSAALKAEKALIQKGIKIKAIPVPRQISSDCGISIRFDDIKDPEAVEHILVESNMRFTKIHLL